MTPAQIATKVLATRLATIKSDCTAILATPAADFAALLEVGERLAQIRRLSDEAIAAWATIAAAQDASWKQIGDSLGVTKQAAHGRYRDLYRQEQLTI